jgi:uncharacterized protein (DUF3820 family)
MSEPLTDSDTMPWGKYGPTKGDHRKLEDIPSEYLLWLWDNGVYRDKAGQNAPLHNYIKESFSALEKDAPDFIVTHRP